MARIDRRTSPNQTTLWTVYELVSFQAVKVRTLADTQRKMPTSRTAALTTALVTVPVRMLRAAGLWLRSLVTAGHGLRGALTV